QILRSVLIMSKAQAFSFVVDVDLDVAASYGIKALAHYMAQNPDTNINDLCWDSAATEGLTDNDDYYAIFCVIATVKEERDTLMGNIEELIAAYTDDEEFDHKAFFKATKEQGLVIKQFK